jgi:hypothetical protein
MQTVIDLGEPTARSRYVIVALAVLNGFLGQVHRMWLMPADLRPKDTLWNTPFGYDTLLFLTCSVTTICCSWYCYSSIYETALRWYTVLTFSDQLVATLSMGGAMEYDLPCCK